jgi:uncharacterized membrane protein YqaE (UPF0057 family)
MPTEPSSWREASFGELTLWAVRWRRARKGWEVSWPLGATVRRAYRNKVVDRLDIERFSMDLLRIIIAILLPPLGVFLQVGIGKHFWINVLLTILGYIPGIVHAVWVIAKY